MTIEQIMYVQKIMNMEPISLSTPVGDENGSEMGDFIESIEPTVDEICIKNDVRRQIEKFINMLDPRGSICIKMYYGFDDGTPKTLEEVGKIYGVTRERIRQILAKSTRKLSMILKRNWLSGNDF